MPLATPEIKGIEKKKKKKTRKEVPTVAQRVKDQTLL